jgi:hypothetical protein
VLVECGLDERWDAVARACVACPPGSFSRGGASVVCQSIRCDLDQYWDAGQRACVACDDGYVSDGGDAAICTAIACEVDAYWDDAQRACLACPAGQVSPGGAVKGCTVSGSGPDCQVGEYWDAADALCIACAAGTASTGGATTTCTPDCPVDTWWDAALQSCRPCPAGEHSAGGDVTGCAAASCQTDFRWDAATAKCVPCATGSWSEGGAVTACTPIDCPVNSRWNAATHVCVACGTGTMSTGGRATSCVAQCQSSGYAAAKFIAGSNTQPGTWPPTDGIGSAARFSHSNTIRTRRSDGALLVYDSSALREVKLEGTVTTLITNDQMCAGYDYVSGYSYFGVDAAGNAWWVCTGGQSYSLHHLTPAGVHGSVAVTGLGRHWVTGTNVGRDDEIYIVYSDRTPGTDDFYPAIARLGRDGVATTVWAAASPSYYLSVPTDLVVTEEHVAFVPDPNMGRIRRIDLVSGATSDVQAGGAALVAHDQHLALDAAGSVYTAGRKISPAGTILATFPNATSQFGIDVVGARDDVVETICDYISNTAPEPSGWACEIVLYENICP